MSNAASFEFRHLHRRIGAGEHIPPMPSLLQQIESLAHDVIEARNAPQLEDEEGLDLGRFDPPEQEEPED